MISEAEVVKCIIDIECLCDPDEDFSDLDEGQQAELGAYYNVLDRELNEHEKAELNKKRKEALE